MNFRIWILFWEFKIKSFKLLSEASRSKYISGNMNKLEKVNGVWRFSKSNILHTIGKNLMWHYLDAITVIFFNSKENK